MLRVCHYIRMGTNVKLKVLKPASWLEVAEGLGIESGPVVDATVKVTNVDVVKVISWPGPIKLGVVDVELAVRRDPRRLNGGDVGADHLGRGELVGKVTVKMLTKWVDKVLREADMAQIPVPVPTSKTR